MRRLSCDQCNAQIEVIGVTDHVEVSGWFMVSQSSIQGWLPERHFCSVRCLLLELVKGP